jgi:hypothetical protein
VGKEEGSSPKGVSRIVRRWFSRPAPKYFQVQTTGSTSSAKKISRCPFNIPVLGGQRIVYSVAGDAEVYNLRWQATAERRKCQWHIIGKRNESYVCVSCVFTHVSRRCKPVSQSFLPCSESSRNLGGMETFATGAVMTAPSISRPGKKQTRWSCLGVSIQVLVTE